VDEVWLAEIASEMDIEDGILVFSDFGVENLRERVRMRKDCPHGLRYPE
jgi:hypothetical protein